MSYDASGSGFVRLTGNKYIAPVSGFSDDGDLEIPDRVYGVLDTETDYFLDHARVANTDEETMGLYSGIMTSLEPSKDIVQGVHVPQHEELLETKEAVIDDGNGEYAVVQAAENPEQVVITFADPDTPMSPQSMGYEQVSAADGVSAYVDRLSDDYGFET